jgi:HlyD family secretion protein
MQFPLGKLRWQPARWVLGLMAAGLLVTGGGTYLVLRNQLAKPDISTMTVPVESEALTVRITASGTVQPTQTVNLSPKTAGILAELLVEQGDRATQGQVIARMENASLEAERLQAQARLAQAEARLARQRSGSRPEEVLQDQAAVEQAEARVTEAQARLDRANDRVRRNQSLAIEGAISQEDLEVVLNEAATAQATLAQNQASLREAQQRLTLTEQGNRVEDIAEAEAQRAEAVANLRAVEIQLEDTIIRAPFSGIITQKYATEGAFVTPTTSASDASSATSTAIVALAEGLEILAEVPEVDIKQLQLGQRVEISADAYPDQTFAGEIRLIAPEAVVKQNVTSFEVRIALLTGQAELRSGMNTNLTFVGDRLQDAVVVPTVAIVTRRGEPGVLVPNDNNRPEFRPVVLGTAVDNETQVLEGLEVGEQVFIDLPPGSDWTGTSEQ